MKYIFSLFILVALLSTFVISGSATDKRAIKEVVTNFSLSGDNRDVGLANNVLHAEAKQYVNSSQFEGGLLIVSTEQYAGLLAAGRIGGIPRTVDIKSIEIDEQKSNAIAQVKLSSTKAVFHSFIGLTKVSDGSWKIVSVLTSTAKPE